MRRLWFGLLLLGLTGCETRPAQGQNEDGRGGLVVIERDFRCADEGGWPGLDPSTIRWASAGYPDGRGGWVLSQPAEIVFSDSGPTVTSALWLDLTRQGCGADTSTRTVFRASLLMAGP